MTLNLNELEPGVVAFLDTRILLHDRRLRRPPNNGTEFCSRPFLCIEVGAGTTSWLALTRQPGSHNQRVRLHPAWLLGPQWWTHGRPQYINDVREPYHGRDVVFADAARGETPFWYDPRPRVSAQGLRLIREVADKLLDTVTEA